MGARNKSGLLRVGGGILGLLLVTAIAVVLNVLLGKLNLRTDITEEKLYTLSDGSKSILGKLDKVVTLKFYYNSSAPEVPIPIKNFARRVEALLHEYKLAAGGKIVVEEYDPKPDSDAEDWAKRYGVAGQQLGMTGPILYLGLVAQCGDTHALLQAMDPRAEDLLEYQISRMITHVAGRGKAIIGVMSSLPVLGSPGSQYAMPGQPRTPPMPAWFVFGNLREDYYVREVQTQVTEIDSDLDVLILVHPKDLTDITLYAIDQFVMRGGRLVVFMDPCCLVEAGSQSGNPYEMPEAPSYLGKLLTGWGIVFENNLIVADMESMTPLRGQDNSVEENPVWLTLRGKNLNREDILTSQLEMMMLPCAGSFEVEESEGVKVTPLIVSSKTSDMVATVMARMNAQTIRQSYVGAEKQHNIAVRLHGKLKSSFPNGKPADETGATTDGPAPADQPAVHLTESQGASSVVVVGDADMLFDSFCVQEMNLMGYRSYYPRNNNMHFFANLVDQMAGGSDLMSIRSRGKMERPFEVVLDLQNKAQEQWLVEEKALQAELDMTQRRLSELDTKKTEEQQSILTAEQREEIERFRKQEIETKAKLKKVRRKLREDIERLGVLVKVINILLVPLLVMLGGIVFWLFRRARTRR